jgi:hypothetical protein
MTAAGAAMIALIFLPAGLDWLVLSRNSNSPLITLLSPAFAFTHTDSYHARDFWLSIAMIHAAGWCCLAAASWLVPKTWHDKGFRLTFAARWQDYLFGVNRTRASRQRLLEKNPICWIISRDRWGAGLARIVVALILVVFVISLISVAQGPPPVTTVPAGASRTITTANGTTVTTTSASYSFAVHLAGGGLYQLASTCSGFLSFALEFWLAAQVCRFYVEGKKSGFLELLFVTPTKPQDILEGHWLAVRRLFRFPVAAQVFLTLACGAIEVWASYSNMVATAATSTSTPSPINYDMLILQVIMTGLGVTSWFIGLYTLVWFSIWMGIKSQKISTALMKTFGYAKVLLWLGLSFVAGIGFAVLMAGGGAGNVPFWFWPAAYQFLFICGNLSLIAFASIRAKDAFSKWSELPVG